MELLLKTKIQNRHDKHKNWVNSTMIPLAGELVIYEADDTNTKTRLKIGDGIHDVNELPFADATYISIVNNRDGTGTVLDDTDISIGSMENLLESGIVFIKLYPTRSSYPNEEYELLSLDHNDWGNTQYYFSNRTTALCIDYQHADEEGKNPILISSIPQFKVDTDLIRKGYAADAKAVGDALKGYVKKGESENETATIIGSGNATGDSSTVIGSGTASGAGATVIGSGEASGTGSTAIGSGTATGDYSVAEGADTLAGCKGYYIAAIDPANRHIYLHTGEDAVIPTWDNPNNFYDETFESGYQIRGDINGDGAVDTVDLGGLQAHLSGKHSLTGEALRMADVDENGAVDFTDLNCLQAITSGKTENITVYTEFSISSDGYYHWVFAGNIIDISGNRITYSEKNSLDNTEKWLSNVNNGADPMTFFIPAQPECGLTNVGLGSHAEGWETHAAAQHSHTEGWKSITAGRYGHAEGNSTRAGFSAHAEGTGTLAMGLSSHAEGSNTQALGNSSHAEGIDTTASGKNSHAEGIQTVASGEDSHAEGYLSIASGRRSHAEGGGEDSNIKLEASGDYSHAEGYATIASGKRAHSEGHVTKAVGDYSHAQNAKTQALGKGSHAEGSYTVATEDYQHVQGKYNHLDDNSSAGNYAHIIGNGTKDARSNAHTIDWEGNAWFAGDAYVGGSGQESALKLVTIEYVDDEIAKVTEKLIGKKTGTSGEIFNSYDKNKAYGDYSHAEGYGTIASGEASHAEGGRTSETVILTGDANATTYKYSSGNFRQHDYFIINNKVITITSIDTDVDTDESTITVSATLSNIAIESTSFTKYRGGLASGNYSHVEGKSTTASGAQSHAEGNSTEASGAQSHAEGYDTVASGNYSHAEGYQTQALGVRSHAEGSVTIAKGEYCHAEGAKTIAVGKTQHVQGRYNIEDTVQDDGYGNYAHIVGNGLKENTYNEDGSLKKLNRSNAHTLDWDGNAWFAGNVTIGKDNKELATKDYVDSKINDEEFRAQEIHAIRLSATTLDTDRVKTDTISNVDGSVSFTPEDVVTRDIITKLSDESIFIENDLITDKNITCGNNLTVSTDLTVLGSIKDENGDFYATQQYVDNKINGSDGFITVPVPGKSTAALRMLVADAEGNMSWMEIDKGV